VLADETDRVPTRNGFGTDAGADATLRGAAPAAARPPTDGPQSMQSSQQQQQQ
jgi:hypothetical protein